MSKRKKPAPEFVPHFVKNPACYLGGTVFARLFVARRTFCGVVVVEAHPSIEAHVGVVTRVIHDWKFGAYPPEDSPLQSSLASLKEQMLRHGATSEAVELVGAVAPFSEEELNIMAEKLKTKSGGAKKDTAAKPAKAGAAKKGGNPEALKKAQEARDGKRAESHARKITVLAKPADSGLRGGRLAKFKGLVDAKPKTVGDILGTIVKDEAGKEHTIDMGALNGMVARGHIKLG